MIAKFKTNSTDLTLKVTWQDFLDFLEQQDALKPYLESLYRRFDGDWQKLKERLDEISPTPKRWVDASFIWSGTDQGHDYWNNLSRLWKSKLKLEGFENITFEFIGDPEEVLDKMPKENTVAYRNLVGQRYRIADFSWNRDATQEAEGGHWEDNSSFDLKGYIPYDWLNGDEERTVLILEDPVWKRVNWPLGTTDHAFVKVYIPKFNKIHWVIFHPGNVVK